MFPYLVKYQQREHVRRFFKTGTVQIGTVRAYDQDTFGAKVGDDDEGVSWQSIDDGNIDAHLNAGYPELQGFGPGDVGNVIRNTNISHNYAIYPTSQCLHKELCLDFKAGYDAAIIIFEPCVFFHCLSNAFSASALTEGVELRHVRPVVYRSRDIGPGEFLQEEFIKDPRYQRQSEVRASWMIGQPQKNFYRFDAPSARWRCLPMLIDDMPDYPIGSDQEVIDSQIHTAIKSAIALSGSEEW